MKHIKLLFLFFLLENSHSQLEQLEFNGGHYRFANIRWKRVSGNLVEFTVESAWRRDFSSTYFQGSGKDGYAITGDIVQLNGEQWPMMTFGDDTMTGGQFLKLTVEAYSVSENWIYGTSVITHRYATPNNHGLPWIATFSGCCKVSPVNNLDSRDQPWSISAAVDLAVDSYSPRIAAAPVYSLPDTNASAATPGAVDWVVPAFHPAGRRAVTLAFASPLTVLTSTATPVTATLEGATGRIRLQLPGVAWLESAESSWALPGAVPLGKFYFVEVNATLGPLFVQAEFLFRMELRDQPIPRILYAPPHSDLPPLPPSDDAVAALGLPALKPRFYPNATYQGYPGFAVMYTLAGYVPPYADGNTMRVVGFGVKDMPRGARLSTMRGTNPAAADFEWLPCLDQLGMSVTCFEAVESGGNASISECIAMQVDPEPVPLFTLAADYTANDPQGVLSHDMAGSTPVLVTLGATKLYTVTAYDVNCQDSISIGVLGTLPAGAELLAQESALAAHPRPDPYCPRTSANSAVRRALQWKAPTYSGGMQRQICFTATDQAGGCGGAGGANATVQCVTFQVVKCRYSVGNEHQLAEVAYLYNTNWLQIWKMNPDLRHPDYMLFRGQTIHIGRLYTIGASDTLAGLASRYGTSLTSLYHLNNELLDPAPANTTTWIVPGYTLCIIPNSCTGQAQGEASQGGLYYPLPSKPQGLYYTSQAPAAAATPLQACASNSNTNGVLYASAAACAAQCLNLAGTPGACSAVASTV